MSSINSEFRICASKLDEICTAFRDSPQLSEESLQPVSTPLLRCSQVLTSWGLDTGASSSVLDHSLRRASKLRTSTVMLLQELNELIAQTAEYLLDTKGKPIMWPGQNPGLGCLTEAEEVIDGLLELRPALLNPSDDSDLEPVPDAEEWSVIDQEYTTRVFAAAPGVLIDRLIRANQRRRENMPSKSRGGVETTQTNSRISRVVAIPRYSASSTLRSDAGVSFGIALSTSWGADSIFSYNTFSDQGSAATSHAFSAATPGMVTDRKPPRPPVDIYADDETSRIITDRKPPRPPVDIYLEGNLPFKCRYCSFNVPLEFRNQSMTLKDWHAHVYLDLQPYNCTFEDCKRSHELFGKKEDWFQHELYAHRIQWCKVWRCEDPVCNTEFQDPTLFKQHLTSDHSDTVSKLSPSSLDVILETCQSWEHEISVQNRCPLCGVSYKESSRTEWKEHIAHHLEQFALLALPMEGQEGMHHMDTLQEEEEDDPNFMGSQEIYHIPPPLEERAVEKREDVSYPGIELEDDIAELSLEKSLKDSVDAVLKDLLSAQVPGYDLRTQYIPIRQIERILNYDTIKAILPECLGLYNSANHCDRTTELATLICGTEASTRMVSYRKSLAVLILSQMETKLQTFLDHRLDDSKLPLYKKATRINECQLCLRGSATPLPCLTGWGSRISSLFYKKQWRVVAPFFRRPTGRRPIDYILARRTPLPFSPIKQEFTPKGTVTYPIENTLTAIEIHRDHTIFLPKVDFDREVAVLKRLSAHPHDHLIKLLFTLELGDQHTQPLPPQPSELFLVFPLPNGDINKLWDDTGNLPPKRVTKSDETRQFALWVARQCRGIAEALSILHNPQPAGQQPEDPAGSFQNREQWYGIHANINPQTLYWFKHWHTAMYPLGNIQLGGFEVSRFYQPGSHEKVVLPHYTRIYSPPDVELGQLISRSFDIWSLGCVFLEFLSWALLGTPNKTDDGGGDDDFSIERSKHSKGLDGIAQDTFYRLISGEERTTADVNPAVIERMQKLHSHEDCTPFLHQFLDIILYEMLVVEVKPLISDIDINTDIDNETGTEKPTAQKRLTSTELVARLDSLINQGEKDRDPDNLFFTEGKPQSTTKMKLTSSVTVKQPIW